MTKAEIKSLIARLTHENTTEKEEAEILNAIVDAMPIATPNLTCVRLSDLTKSEFISSLNTTEEIIDKIFRGEVSTFHDDNGDYICTLIGGNTGGEKNIIYTSQYINEDETAYVTAYFIFKKHNDLYSLVSVEI